MVEPTVEPGSVVVSEGDAGGGGAAAKPPAGAQPPQVNPHPPAGAPPPPAAAPPVKPPAEPPKDPPAADDDWKMSREAFNDRIGQAKRSAEAAAAEKHKAWLRERYGTDDSAEIDKQIVAQKKLQEDAEKKRREEMTELERYKADLEAEKKRREAAEMRALEIDRQRRFDRQDAAISKIAAKHVDVELADDAALLFARYVRKEKSAEEAKKISEKDVDKWFADFVKRKPAWKKADGAEPPKPKPKQPVTTGQPPTGQPAPQAAGGLPEGKTLRPGQRNSMTKEEVEAYKRERGIQW